MQVWQTQTASVEQTEELGRNLGAAITEPLVIALIGDLGAGKTHFTKGIVAGLGGNSEEVTSPTFVLIQEYEARLPIYHFDAYRLKNLEEFVDLGAEELFYSETVCIVEWADRVLPCLPTDHLRIELTTAGDDLRELRIVGIQERAVDLASRLFKIQKNT